MKYKWQLFWAITIFCLLGTAGLGYIAYTSTPPSNSSTFIEVVKTLFLCLGGLGVILPLYINATNAIESRASKKIENTYNLLAKWDDPHLFEARKYTRDIKKRRTSISDDELISQIKDNEILEQSVILVANYFEHVRFSILNNRVDANIFKNSLGPVVLDILKRFMPYFKSISQQHADDFVSLEKLLD